MSRRFKDFCIGMTGILTWQLLLSFLLFAPVLGQTVFGQKLSDTALSIINPEIIYDPAYFSIAYPNGDVPADRGVCIDLVIRAYRRLGIDLQKEVHEDMQMQFQLYPKIWGLNKPDANIDHRRVPNLMIFFQRKGHEKPITLKTADYVPGDIVCWDLGNGLTHIGIVVDRKSADEQRNLIVHNIGNGQVLADCLFEFRIMGHYVYHGQMMH